VLNWRVATDVPLSVFEFIAAQMGLKVNSSCHTPILRQSLPKSYDRSRVPRQTDFSASSAISMERVKRSIDPSNDVREIPPCASTGVLLLRQ
jgi:hypothetical protein